MRQVTRDRWLRQLENIDQIANTKLASREQIQNAEASWMGKSLKDGVEILKPGSGCVWSNTRGDDSPSM